jgi:hypothetical protein
MRLIEDPKGAEKAFQLRARRQAIAQRILEVRKAIEGDGSLRYSALFVDGIELMVLEEMYQSFVPAADITERWQEKMKAKHGRDPVGAFLSVPVFLESDSTGAL